MNDRSISLALTLLSVLGTPIAANAQEQPESPPPEPDSEQATAPDPIHKAMATATPQTAPTVELAAAIAPTMPERSPQSGFDTAKFSSQRQARPATPSAPRPVLQASAPSSDQPNALPQRTAPPATIVVKTLPIAPLAPSHSPTLPLSHPPTSLSPRTEQLPTIEFSAPRLAQPTLAQSTPIVVPVVPEVPATQPSDPLQEQLSTLEQRQQQLEREIEQLKQNLAGAQKTAPAVAIVEDRAQNFTISATGVFFKPRNSNPFDYAVEDAGNALALNGNLQTAEYDRGAGVRIGLSYQPPSSALDLAVAYTSFNTSGSDQAIAPANGFLFTTSSPRQNERAGIANATIALDYNNTDLELGYKFRVGKSLGLRLFGGLKFAAIDQALVANYDQIDYTGGRIETNNDFSGFGPRLGAEARILLGSGFSLFGRGAASLLLGDLTSSYRETDNNGADLVANVQRRQSQTVPVLEAAIGLDWQAALGKRAKLNLSAGYEYQHWFNTSEDLRFVNASNPGLFTRSSGDLSLDGFFVKGALSFEF